MPLDSLLSANMEQVLSFRLLSNKDEPMDEGTIILLNGTSSAGKTLITKTLQETLDGNYIHTGIDHYLQSVPEKFSVTASVIDPPTAEGILWLTGNDGRITEIRLGPVGYRLLKGMYWAIAALASVGNNVIVDDVIFDPRVLREAVSTLHLFNVLFVGVRCPLEVAERREQERGDRRAGLVKTTFPLVHRHGIYDLEVDTSVSSSMECALQIKQRLQNGATPTAFSELYRKLASD